MRAPVISVLVSLLLVPVGVADESLSPEEIAIVFDEDFRDFWRSSNPIGLATLWTEDGDWMSLVGSRRIVRGRKAIAGVWEVGLQGRESVDQLSLKIEFDQILLLTSTSAQVDLLMTFGTPTTGITREAMTAIVVETNEGWKIRTARVARIPDR